MFFILSRILTIVTVPSNLLVTVVIAGIALLATRFRAVGRRLLVAAALVTAAIWLLRVGALLTVPLEARFPPWSPAQGAPTGVIVLGGVINERVSVAHGQIALDASAERLTSAVVLARQYPDARIVFSGGNARLIGGRPEGPFALRFLEQLGVAHDRITIEPQSRNTAENAVYCKRLIAPRPGERWLLITSAMHMPRAVGAFRQVGFAVEPYPVDYQSTGRVNLLSLPGSALGALAATDAAAHEWLGLLAYWITGRIPVLLPGPAPGKATD
jgi:uncharacterized SAM-binding protein YcdF (DUF218 family)